MEAYQPLIQPLIKILVIVLVIVIIKKWFDLLKDKFRTQQNYSSIGNIDLEDTYSQKKYFFSLSELKMYYLLRDFFLKEYHAKYAVFPKVRMFDIIKVNTYNHTDKDKIAKKHVDFLIVDQTNHCNMVLAIELNWPSHETDKNIERDEFVSEVYASIGLEFTTFLNDDLNNKEYVLNKLRWILNK